MQLLLPSSAFPPPPLVSSNSKQISECSPLHPAAVAPCAHLFAAETARAAQPIGVKATLRLAQRAAADAALCAGSTAASGGGEAAAESQTAALRLVLADWLQDIARTKGACAVF